MGGPPSSTYIHDRGGTTCPCKAGRPDRNSYCYIHWTPEQRSRTTDPSLPRTRTSGPSTPPPLESVAIPGTDAIPASPTQIDPTTSDTSDDELPIDPTTVTPHKTFYLKDGNVEVLCGNVLFRVHTSVLSFHSPALRKMFAQTNLAAAEPPNGCPRITSSDSVTDFTTLLKIIYLPGFVVPPESYKILPLTPVCAQAP